MVQLELDITTSTGMLEMIGAEESQAVSIS